MTVIHYLIGYDRCTDFATRFHRVGEADVGTAMKIAAFYGDWPLTDEAAADIATLAGTRCEMVRNFCRERQERTRHP